MASETGAACPTAFAPALVLDTNAVLDWLVFCDPRMPRLVAALEAGAVRWLACAGMRDELEHTLGYPSLAKWSHDSERVLSMFDRYHIACPAPPTAGLPGLRCSDPDDQVFIDLALAQGARWLVTHDRALHRLARQAWAAGVQVLRPADWPGSVAMGAT